MIIYKKENKNGVPKTNFHFENNSLEPYQKNPKRLTDGAKDLELPLTGSGSS